jgi:cyclopropane fatty-acyl-phospholipid synthase-like methyltransferase
VPVAIVDGGIAGLGALATASPADSRLMIHEVEEIGPHSVETPNRRRKTFDERAERTWNFYLAFCELWFGTRSLQRTQLTPCRPNAG